LRRRVLTLAGALLELTTIAERGRSEVIAMQVLEDGRAWNKFQRICEAQGGMRVPRSAPQHQPLLSTQVGHPQSKKI
jgi:thymidine phosphorylase